MQAEFRLQGPGGDSGIQFRSQETADWDLSGYQADIENGVQWTGCLFEHKRGGVVMRGEKAVIAPDGKKAVEPLLTPEETAKLPNALPGDSPGSALIKQVKQGEWNTYVIVARGPDITLFINGVKMCQVRDRAGGGGSAGWRHRLADASGAADENSVSQSQDQDTDFGSEQQAGGPPQKEKRAGKRFRRANQ